MTLGYEKLDVYGLSIDSWSKSGYDNGQNDFDPDSDFDLDKEQPQRGH